MKKQDVCAIDDILKTLEIPDDNVMLDTLLELAEEQERKAA